MTKRILQLLSLLIAGVAVVGCSTSQRLLKQGDPEIIYNHALELYEAEEWNKAVTMFDAVQPYYAGQGRDDSLSFYRARCKFKDNDFIGATTLLESYRRTFSRSPFMEDAEGMYALSQYYQSPSAVRDQTTTAMALVSINEFLTRYPNSDKRETFEGLRDELIGRMYEKSFLNAYTYYKIGRYKSAIIAFRNSLKEYPESTMRETLLYYTVASAYELARNSIIEKKEDRYLEMMDVYYTFIAEFPESEFRDEVDDMLEHAQKYIDNKKKRIDNVEEKEFRLLFWRSNKERRQEMKALKAEDKAREDGIRAKVVAGEKKKAEK